MNNQYDNLIQALADLLSKGISQSMFLSEKGIYCPISNKHYTPDEVKIIEYHRFEGDSDEENIAILYVIETNDACKGVVIDAFGTYSDSDLGEFLKKTQFK